MSGRRLGYSSTNCERKLLTYSSILNSLGEIPMMRLRMAGCSFSSLPLDVVACFTRIFLPFTGLRSSACSSFTLKSLSSACFSTSQNESAVGTCVARPRARDPTCRTCTMLSGENTQMRFSLNASSQSISVHSAFFTSRGAVMMPLMDVRRCEMEAAADSMSSVPAEDTVRSSAKHLMICPPSSSKPPYVYSLPLLTHIRCP
mmetsp:Transcript_16097/g.39208  ORF Transcript_16097/g.39208 Transcript_16097/m.39208 type:complete len:202 (-) Transcript_16097:1094-1699(-)